jgi:DNA-binding transcriptional ArsR family regulator
MPTEENVTRFADMFSAIGTGPRLRIMRLLLAAHPDGMAVNEIGQELGMPASTLSHNLDKLKNKELVRVSREGCQQARPLLAAGGTACSVASGGMRAAMNGTAA